MSLDRQVCKLALERWSDFGTDTPPPAGLVFVKLQSKLSNNGSIVALLCDEQTGATRVVVKIPRNPEVTTAIDREANAMAALTTGYRQWANKGSISNGGFRETIAGLKVLFQEASDGSSMVRQMTGRESIAANIGRSTRWLLEFHKHAATQVTLAGDQLESHVLQPVALFGQFLSDNNLSVSAGVEQYLQDLPGRVDGASLSLISKHGDFNAHNIVIRDAAAGSALFVIDWEDFSAAQLPIYDLNHFFTSNSKLVAVGKSAEQAYASLMMTQGWYQSEYRDAVSRYEQANIVDAATFYALSPLYLVDSALRMTDENRQQQGTIDVWLDRLEQYVRDFAA